MIHGYENSDWLQTQVDVVVTELLLQTDGRCLPTTDPSACTDHSARISFPGTPALWCHLHHLKDQSAASLNVLLTGVWKT
jgi:hypothetical protein